MLNFNDVRKYVKGVMSGSFQNKETIDKLSESDGKLLFNGEEIKGGGADVQIATTDKAGIVKPDGTTIKIDADGTIHGSNTYTLPKATTTVLGGVKVDGTTITADTNGVIHGANTYELPVATDEVLGGVKVDGTSITIDQDGTLHGASTYELPVASDTVLGGIKVDGETVTIDDDGVISASAGNDIQVEALPEPSDEYYHKVLQYVGETTDSYTAGLFYRCNDDADATSVTISGSGNGVTKSYKNTNDYVMTYTTRGYFNEGEYYDSNHVNIEVNGNLITSLKIPKSTGEIFYTGLLNPGEKLEVTTWGNAYYLYTRAKTVIKKASQYKWEAVSGAIKGIEDIDNVTITSPQNKQSLIYDSETSSWINGGASIDGINYIPDVDIANQQDKQVLTYDSSTSKWTNKSIEIPKIDKVSDINDVTLTDVKDKQALVWDEANSKWVNGNVASSGGGNTYIVDGDVYSSYEEFSEEEKVIGKYIDGKPLYRKVKKLSTPISLSTSSSNTIDIGVSNIDSVVGGAVIRSSQLAASVSSTSLVYTSFQWFQKAPSANSSIVLRGTSAISNIDIIIAEYTKTTDPENSFTPDMILSKTKVAPAEIYSTDETIIGQWIDGKNIYRKVFNNISVDTGTSQNAWKTLKTFDVPLQLITCKVFYNGLNALYQYSECNMGGDQKTLQIRTLSTTNRTITGFIIEYTKTTD